MSKLSTKNITTGGDGVSKTLEPGIVNCKINGVSLEEFSLKPGAYNIVLHLEGEALGEGFQGFYVDKDRPELGRHTGKVGNVKATEWAFADGETKSGIAVSRDMEMLKWLKQFCMSVNLLDWFDGQDEKHDTIESFFRALTNQKPYGGNYYTFCIAGKEYTNRSGYNAYDLFLPKFSKEGVPVEIHNASPSKLIKFKPEDHIKRKKAEPVNEFGGDTSTPGISTDGSDFDL